MCELFSKIFFFLIINYENYIVGDRIIARAFKFERARGRARSAISAAPRLADMSMVGEGVAADFRAVATVRANGASRAGWSVTGVWYVHARATDAIQPTCEEACVRSVLSWRSRESRPTAFSSQPDVCESQEHGAWFPTRRRRRRRRRQRWQLWRCDGAVQTGAGLFGVAARDRCSRRVRRQSRWVTPWISHKHATCVSYYVRGCR